MALNLTPDYFEADRKYRQATSTAEKLAALEEMLRTIPKHKSSEKKQADIKRRMSELRQAPAKVKKGGAGADPYHIPPQGAGQVLLFGLPNSGKSSLLAARSKAPVKITDFPFGSPAPVPGMAYHEDVPIEFVDLPPVTPEHMPPGMINALRNTNILLLVVDLAAASVLEDVDALLGILRERGIAWDEVEHEADDEEGDEHEAMRVDPQGIIVCTKCDGPGADDNWEILQELRTGPPPMMRVSAHTGEGMDELLRMVFEGLNVVRLYSKLPGKLADKEKPFVLPAGSTVGELAKLIHKELADKLKFARVWGESAFDGQQVHGSHVLADRDIVELHV